MPDFYTHIINGKESLTRLNYMEGGRNFEFSNLFYLGCMGPDIFLYHDFYPWKKNKCVSKLGNDIHIRYCGDFIVSGLEYINNNRISNITSDCRILYLLGYICHYAADRIAHPFVFSRSGLYDSKRPDTYKYKNTHKIMELSIDYHMAKKIYGQNVNRLKLYRYIEVGKDIPKCIMEIYDYLFKIYFNEMVINLDRNFINNSYKSIVKAWKILYDPLYIKRYLAKVFRYQHFFYPINPDERDYMNEENKPWPHPCKGSEKSKENFYEVFERSVELAVTMMKASLDYLDGKKDIYKLREAIGNFSFLTNMDTSKPGQEMIFFQNIFEN